MLQGYSSSRTHLHIWIAANSHASYNRNENVYRIEVNVFGPVAYYHDRLDYNPTGNNLYFQYDELKKLGEVTQNTNIKCPDSNYTYEWHCYPLGSGSTHWLAYVGKLGDYYLTGSPYMPSIDPGDSSHEWLDFTNASSFGFTSWYYVLVYNCIDWISDDSIGD